jgi:hypothetical protein
MQKKQKKACVLHQRHFALLPPHNAISPGTELQTEVQSFSLSSLPLGSSREVIVTMLGSSSRDEVTVTMPLESCRSLPCLKQKMAQMKLWTTAH